MLSNWRVAALLALSTLALTGGSASAQVPSNHWSAGAAQECMQPGVGTAPADCAQHATDRLGGADDATLLLPFFSFSLIQDEPIQDARLHLRVLGPAPVPAVHVLLYRITSFWSADDPATLPARWDAHPLADLVPDASGAIDVDVTAQVDDWLRYRLSAQREGHPNFGFAVRVAYDDPFEAHPAVELGSSRILDVTLRPSLETTTWSSASESEVTAVSGPPTPGKVALSLDTAFSSIRSVRYQYLTSGMTHWADIPLGALRDFDSDAPLATTTVPVVDHRALGVAWDVGASPGGETDGLVRVRGLVDGTESFVAGATSETSFLLDRPDVPGPFAPEPEDPDPPVIEPADPPATAQEPVPEPVHPQPQATTGQPPSSGAVPPVAPHRPHPAPQKAACRIGLRGSAHRAHGRCAATHKPRHHRSHRQRHRPKRPLHR